MNFCSYVPSNFLSTSRVIRNLGEGSHGQIKLIETADGQKYAVKQIDIHDDSFDKGISQNALYEIDALIRLKGAPNIIQMIGVCNGPLGSLGPLDNTESNNTNSNLSSFTIKNQPATAIASSSNVNISICSNTIATKDTTNIILEAMDSDLIKYIINNDFNTRLNQFNNLFLSLIRGKAYMEALNINHYDIKPDNILVRNDNRTMLFVLSDFGLTRINFSDYINLGYLFTLWYRAPEYLANRDRRTFQNYSGDIWAIGMCLIIYILGGNPFALDTSNDILARIQMFTNQRNVSFAQFKDYIEGKCPTGLSNMTNDYLDVNLIFSTNMSPTDYAKLSPITIQYIQSMMNLNPDARPTAQSLLQTVFGESVILPDKIGEIPVVRKVTAEGIELIYRLGVSCTMTAASMLMAIELFTRFLGIYSIQYPGLQGNLNFAIISCCRIANIYLEGTYRSYSKFIKSYISIISNVIGQIPNVTLNELYISEKILLDFIQYKIYNIGLTPLIKRVYERGVMLDRISFDVYSQNLSLWSSYFN